MDISDALDRAFEPLQKPLTEWGGREYTIALLSVIATGTIAISVLAAPNLVQVFTLFKAKNRKERYRISARMRQLERSGYIEKTKKQYVLTRKGETRLNEEYVWGMKPPIPKQWDHRWHFVAFDIPGEKRFERSRQALRARLFELGFVRHQDSLFVHRYDMRTTIEQFAVFYGIEKFLTFIVATKIDNEQAVAKQCRLPT